MLSASSSTTVVLL